MRAHLFFHWRQGRDAAMLLRCYCDATAMPAATHAAARAAVHVVMHTAMRAATRGARHAATQAAIHAATHAAKNVATRAATQCCVHLEPPSTCKGIHEKTLTPRSGNCLRGERLLKRLGSPPPRAKKSSHPRAPRFQSCNIT